MSAMFRVDTRAYTCDKTSQIAGFTACSVLRSRNGCKSRRFIGFGAPKLQMKALVHLKTLYFLKIVFHIKIGYLNVKY